MKYTEPKMNIVMFNTEEVIVASAVPGVTETTQEPTGSIEGGED